jgi:hypothetical protein
MATPREIATQARRLARELKLLADLLTEGDRKKPKPKHLYPPKATTQEKPDKDPVAEETVKVARHSYDSDPSSPTFNPEPPFRVDKPPPRENPLAKQKVLITKGAVSLCRKCNQPAVMASEDITSDNLKLDKFKILHANRGWPKKVDVDKRGGICVTCPLCGELGLWLVGQPPRKDEGVGAI